MSDCPLGWHVNYNILKSEAHYLGSSLKYIKRLRMCGNFYNLRSQRQNEYACSATRAIKAFRATIFLQQKWADAAFSTETTNVFLRGVGGGGGGWGLSSEEAMTRRTKMTTGARNHVKGCSTSVTKFTPVTKNRFSLGEIYDKCGTRNFPENCNLICFDLALFPRNENKQLKF